MRTTCPDCDTAYTVPDDRIGPKGRKVRCTRCGAEWRAMLETAPPPAADDPFAAIEAEPRHDDPFETGSAPPPAASAPAGAASKDPFDVDFDDVETDDEAETTAAADVDAAAEATVDPAPLAEPPAAATPKLAAKPISFLHPKRRRSFAPHLPAVSPRLQALGGVAVFLIALLFCAGLVVFRTEVVARAPTLAGFYRLVGLPVNLRGVAFGPIETLRETEDGKPVLVVEGSLVNSTGAAHDVPALRFALRDADGQELYAWSIDPRATTVAAGDRMRFRTRLVAPPERAADLQVRFAERRNRQAGLP